MQIAVPEFHAQSQVAGAYGIAFAMRSAHQYQRARRAIRAEDRAISFDATGRLTHVYPFLAT
jgi:hypothetical protein